MVNTIKKKWWEKIKSDVVNKNKITSKLVELQLEEEFWLNIGIPSTRENSTEVDLNRLREKIELELIRRKNLVKPIDNFNQEKIEIDFKNEKIILFSQKNNWQLKKIISQKGFNWNNRERYWEKIKSKMKTEKEQIEEITKKILEMGYGVTTTNEIIATYLSGANIDTPSLFDAIIDNETRQAHEAHNTQQTHETQEEKNGGNTNVRNANSESLSRISNEMQTTPVQGIGRESNTGKWEYETRDSEYYRREQEKDGGIESFAMETKSSATRERFSSSLTTQNEVSNVSGGNNDGRVIYERINNIRNYSITTSDNIDKTGLIAKYSANILAIQLLKQLEKENRQAIKEEQSILAQYSGWGGLPQVFNETNEGYNKQYKEIKELLTGDEFTSARRSTLNSHYTSSEIVKGVWDIVDRLGFKEGNILEPSMGIGNFIGLIPEKISAKSRITGVEIDDITGRLAKKIYPDARIEITGYENLQNTPNHYDLIISNVPFGDYKPYDPDYNSKKYRIHNYFFSKSLEQARENGIIAFITSTGTMQGTTDAQILREELAEKTELLGAIRLPSNAFKNANTKVTTDLIVLRKLRENEKPTGHKWQNIVDSTILGENGLPLKINEYYAENPQMMLGKLVEDQLYGKRNGRIALNGDGINIEEKLKEIIEIFPKDIINTKEITENNQQNFILSPEGVRSGAFIELNGKIYQSSKGYLELISKNQTIIRDYINLRDTLKKLLQKQIAPDISDENVEQERVNLNKAYDIFVKNHGVLDKITNARALSEDPEYGITLGLETIDNQTKKVKKATIFSQRTVGRIIEKTSFDNPFDALSDCLSNKGKIEIDYMLMKLKGMTEKELVKHLGSTIYKDSITDKYIMSDEYLSGNVREKLKQAKERGTQDQYFQRNIQALEKVQPKDLESHEVFIKIGSPFVEEEDIQKFATHMLLSDKQQTIEIIKTKYLSSVGKWIVTWNYDKNSYLVKETINSLKNTSVWGTEDKSFYDLFQASLNNKKVEIYDFKEGQRILNQEKTLIAQQKQKEINDEFEKWIWNDEERSKKILTNYNEKMNSYRLREYDGSHLTLPGYSITAPQLNSHQKNAVWRIVQSTNTLLAHCVGAGKTWTMQVAAMEKKRLGLINKPIFVVPNHMIEQFYKEFKMIYPNANILTVTSQNLPDIAKNPDSKNNEKNNNARQKMLSRIAYENWDGIIISHEMFKRIPMSPEATNKFYREQLDEAREGILTIKSEKNNKLDTKIIKELEKKEQFLMKKLQENVNERLKDIVIPFENLGIDQIFVDEADMFKNLYFPTSLSRISGIANSDSQRSTDMFMKTQYCKNIVFATGTPISNTMAEMFTMMRYMDMETLKANRLNYFDNWINQFGKIGLSAERSPTGNGYRTVTKITSFINTPELITMFRKFADVKTAEELELPKPLLKNGVRTVISIEGSQELKHFITNEVMDRVNAMKGNNNLHIDNMLKLTTDLRHASLDMRLIKPQLLEKEEANKIVAVSEMVYKKWDEEKENKGSQLIFCDLSTPKALSDKGEDVEGIEEFETNNTQGKISVYAEINKYLKRKGIPADEIAFIHDAKTKESKQKLFDKINNGEIRVLIGSTSKMGAGTNVQKKLVALHHLDCPWRPRDIEQREGRILRQGNENKEVEIFTYVTKNSFDANMWEKVKNKAKIITQALSNNLTDRVIEDADAVIIGYAEAEALASGNPLMAEKTMLDAEIYKYDTLYSNYLKKQKTNERMIEQIPSQIEKIKIELALYNQDIKNRIDTRANQFSIVLGACNYNDRKIANDKLQEIIKRKEKTLEKNFIPSTIGSFGGFDLKIGSRKICSENNSLFENLESRTIDLVLQGKKNYIANTNTIQGLEYTLNNTLDKFQTDIKTEIERLEKNLEQYTKESSIKFSELEKLTKLKERQKFINIELQITQKTHETQKYQRDGGMER